LEDQHHSAWIPGKKQPMGQLRVMKAGVAMLTGRYTYKHSVCLHELPSLLPVSTSTKKGSFSLHFDFTSTQLVGAIKAPSIGYARMQLANQKAKDKQLKTACLLFLS
jgi:hypothetical protein